MSGTDWDSTSFDQRVGCWSLFLLVPANVAGYASQAFAVRTVWIWYPPVDIPAPSLMHVAALLFLIGAAVRGIGKSESYTWTNRRWADAVFRPALQPLVALGVFALLRWLVT